MNLEYLMRTFPPHLLREVTYGIERAVRMSFRTNPVGHPGSDGYTGSELKARVQWCVERAVELRAERRWSTERICDTLPGALRTYLITGDWTIPEGDAWFGF